MINDEPDDVIEVGSERTGLRAARWRRNPLVVAAVALVAAAVAVTLVVVGVRSASGGRPHAVASSARPSASPPSPPFLAPVADAPTHVDLSYLYSDPAEDMTNAEDTAICRQRCNPEILEAADLRRRGREFAGLRPVAGGFLTDPRGRVVLVTLDGVTASGSVVHLLIVTAGRARNTSVSERRVFNPGSSRSVTVREVRSGWRFSASVAAPVVEPPADAARRWVATAALPT